MNLMKKAAVQAAGAVGAVVKSAANTVSEVRETVKMFKESVVQNIRCTKQGFKDEEEVARMRGCCPSPEAPGVTITNKAKNNLTDSAIDKIESEILSIYARIDKKLLEERRIWWTVLWIDLFLSIACVPVGGVLFAQAIAPPAGILIVLFGIVCFVYIMVIAKKLRTLQIEWGYLNMVELNETVAKLNAMFDGNKFHMKLRQGGKDVDEVIEEKKRKEAAGERDRPCPELTTNWCGWMCLCFCGCEDCLVDPLFNCVVDYEIFIAYYFTLENENEKVELLPTI